MGLSYPRERILRNSTVEGPVRTGSMNILIATDGSEFSKLALTRFCQLFGSIEGLAVKVLSVVQPAAVPASPNSVSAGLVREMDELSRRHALAIVQRAARELRSTLRTSVEISEALALGAPEKTIVDEAAKWGADLIVTGSHGDGYLKRTWFGSVSGGVVHNAPCSVLVLRKDAGPLK
jgi:nucleotide-binding universal stress UspA family protein